MKLKLLISNWVIDLLDLFDFDETIKQNFINERNSSIKFIISIFLLINVFINNEFLILTIILIEVLFLSIWSQGVKRILNIYWSLKFYLVLVFIITLIFNQFKVDNFIIQNILKLAIIFILFSFFTKTTTPEKLIDMLIQLKIPVNIAWSIGLAFRQAILILEDVYYIQTIQRLRLGYHQMSISNKIMFRVNEIYTMLVSMLARSIIISTEFAIALKMRGWKGAHQNIILNNSPIKIADYLFLIFVVGITLTILFTL